MKKNPSLALASLLVLVSLPALAFSSLDQTDQGSSPAEVIFKLASQNQIAIPQAIIKIEKLFAQKKESTFDIQKYKPSPSERLASGPTTSGGGGNICFTSKGPRLLDMVWTEKSLVPQNQAGLMMPSSGEKFQAFTPLQGPLQKKIESLTQKFIARFPFEGKVLSTSLENNWFFAVPTIFSSPIEAHYQSPELCHSGNVRAAIALIGGFKFISIPMWNSLDLETQAYLVIHEAWRFAQVVLGFELSNQALQKLTFDSIEAMSEHQNFGPTRGDLIRAINELIALRNANIFPQSVIENLIESYDQDLQLIDQKSLLLASQNIALKSGDIVVGLLKESLKMKPQISTHVEEAFEKLLSEFLKD